MSRAVKKSGIATSAPSAGAEVKRWSANRNKEVVLRLLPGTPGRLIPSSGLPNHALQCPNTRGRHIAARSLASLLLS